jgi:hypothetical protein
MTNDINDAKAPVTKEQQDMIAELAGILEMAKAGKITSFGAVLVYGPGQLNVRFGRANVLELYFGCDALQDGLKAFMLQNAAQQQAKGSRILRAGALPPGMIPGA